MGQDLRKLFECDEQLSSNKMKEGHEARFLEKLNEELPASKKPSFYYMKVAAAVIMIFASGLIGYTLLNPSIKETTIPDLVSTDKEKKNVNKITLGNISPELKKVEDYYTANINLELSEIEITEENKQLLDGYMNRLTDLDEEYKKLSVELNEVGPNDQNITALINNLQIRLQLLYQLKEKLKELKENQNEKFKNQQV